MVGAAAGIARHPTTEFGVDDHRRRGPGVMLEGLDECGHSGVEFRQKSLLGGFLIGVGVEAAELDAVDGAGRPAQDEVGHHAQLGGEDAGTGCPATPVGRGQGALCGRRAAG
jgi:hypothetical protein